MAASLRSRVCPRSGAGHDILVPMTFPRKRLVVVLLVLAAVLTIAYWAAWYGHRSWVASSTDRSYEDFENAFPIADAWLALTAMLAAWSLAKGRPSALL